MSKELSYQELQNFIESNPVVKEYYEFLKKEVKLNSHFRTHGFIIKKKK